jgi:hypothetical protein
VLREVRDDEAEDKEGGEKESEGVGRLLVKGDGSSVGAVGM